MIRRSPTIAFVLVLLPQIVMAAENGAIDTGTTAWMLTSTALVLLMIPGLAMFYGGLVRTKNVLGTMMHSFVAVAVIGVLWVVCGYSLAFGKNILGGFVGWTVWNQFLIQMMGMGATIGMAVVGTIIIVFIVEKTLGFRIDEQSEIEGLDQSLHGEHGYGLAHPDLMA